MKSRAETAEAAPAECRKDAEVRLAASEGLMAEWRAAALDLRAEAERLRDDLATARARIGELEKALNSIEAKAKLGSQMMADDERGQSVAKGFDIIAEVARSALSPNPRSHDE